MAGVKNKIRWGTAFLFMLLVLSGGLGIYAVLQQRLLSRSIVKANYESLFYAQRMHASFDSVLRNNRIYLDSFAIYLKLQEANITEKGEAQATAQLRHLFAQAGTRAATMAPQLRDCLNQILAVNINAIQSKLAIAEQDAKESLAILVTVVSVILIIGFVFVVNFPLVLTSPIYKLTEAIKQIGSKNYQHRIHIQSKDEFGALATAFNEMAGRLEYFENSTLAKIIFEKSRAEAVINSLKDASIGIDKTNKVLFANNQALQLLGLAANEIVGKPVSDVGKRNDLFRFLLEEQGTIPFKIVVDGKENFFTKEVVDVGDPKDESKVIVLKNITSFKELDVAKTNFIATVSHELKTPLAASDFSLKLMNDERVGVLTPEQKELVQNLKENNQRMLRILSELLNMSQIEAGKIQLNIQTVNPHSVVEASVEAVATAAKAKEVKIEKSLELQLPDIEADSDKMSWVLNNFLTNAIKYSPPQSTVLVEVKHNGHQISFSVKDAGQGIDEIYLSRIFERYFQVPGRSYRQGSGIGLAICKELVEAMGGAVWVKSALGGGSTFGFDLPVS